MRQLTNGALNQILAVTGDDQAVWTNQSDLSFKAESSESDSGLFVQLPWVQCADAIYILGTERNSSLICALENECINNADFRPDIYIGAPGKDFRFSFQHEPSYVISYMTRLCTQAASVGGWHLLEPNDFCQYLLMREVERSEGLLNPTIKRILRKHPAWAALSFIPTVDEEAAARMLVEIIDPRWYVDSNHPDRLSNLKGFMGLTDRNIRGVLTGAAISDRYYRRANILYRAWAGGTEGYSDCSYDIDHPGNFLLRKLRDYNVGLQGTRKQCKTATVRAVLRTCNHFLAFLRNVWLHQITNTSFNTRKVDLFIPEYFFERQEDSEAYCEHLEKILS